jgi:hypothetical protein
MNNFNDWNDVLAMKGLREAVVAYAIAEAPEYLEDGADGVKGLSDDDYPYVLERAMREKGECVFFFSRGAEDQIEDHAHYRFAGMYFECDGAGQICGPYDDNNVDIVLDLLSDAYEAGFVASPEPGDTVSVSGDFPDDFFIKLCTGLVPFGQQIEINGTLYVRTTEGLASVKLP